ncbi:peptidoglycan DD-metalloendopeptidase family protein [candidate division WOR-3 bacterium]|uniref:Peptidoglycan DD-metalloendopeptidase family protein n=1 Tax=candidate division WOR-3 bacterium TaxID=2052148 RepID=A0A9D5K9W1_UNCW3|nr:peptidoglycan DD-metalloendopeptidase family protein [candidate division WOR-3 bacterium]MBD3364309.1 peptidoglycan DD-metalloendopeptidase family protein [candidate division WOR-3 bacterium]
MIKNDITLIILSGERKEPRRLHFSRKFLNAAIYTFFFLAAVGLVRLGFYAHEIVRLRPMSTENVELHSENDSLYIELGGLHYSKDSLLNEIETERVSHARRLAEVTDELERLENFVTDLKILAGYKLSKEDAKKLPSTSDSDSASSDLAIGGAEIETESYLEGLLETTRTELGHTIDNEAITISKALREKRNDLRDLRNFLEKKATLLEGRPIGWPTSGMVSSEFGPRGRGFHSGIDIANTIGTPIYATGDGVVTFKGYVGAMGKEVEINHGKEFTTVYGHLSRYAVEIGDRVERGDVIGYIGNTGRSTGSHLHYEVRVNGVPVNPRPYLEKEGK